MKIKELALAAMILVLILGLSLASNSVLERYLGPPADKPAAAADNVAMAPAGSACVDAKGSWVNWPWANVPALSPACPSVPPEPREPEEKK